jgi:aryl-alcohol dehydrogenase-like predicted oxidoreductase
MLRGVEMPGCASKQGTARFAARAIAQAGDPERSRGYGMLGATGLTVSRLGFGTYRVDTSESAHRSALQDALRSGCNLIDTSTNYMDGDSERLIGSVMKECVATGDVLREEVVVVSKIGYVQGHNLKAAQAREAAGRPYPDMVKYEDGVWHCIHPEFLADQLRLSRDRLGLATVDVCLLHNPEYFLLDAIRRGETDLVALRERFYQRVTRAFMFFEEQVAAGGLQYYGVSSNTVAMPADRSDATSLSRMLDAAAAAAAAVGAASHHCRVLQCPMNVFESGAFMTPNTGPGEDQTALDAAQAAGIAVLVNRPLNAMPGPRSGMMRLAELPLEDQPVEVTRQLATVRRLEQDYREKIAPAIQHAGQGLAPADFFTWADELERVRPQVQGIEHWEQIEHHRIAPHVNQVLQAVSRHLTGTVAEQWEDWRDRYVPELLGLLQGFRREAMERSRARARLLTDAIDPLLPPMRRHEPLSRKALWIAASTPGVTCVLNGMRSPAYVKDSLAVLGWAPLDDVRPVYERVQSLEV